MPFPHLCPPLPPRGPVGGGRGSSGGRNPPNLEVFHFLALPLIEVPLPISDPPTLASFEGPSAPLDRFGGKVTRNSPSPLIRGEGTR